jgi:hypothetical protein
VTDERRVSRKEGISIHIERIDKTYTAEPLPWRKRNDFGDEVIQQYLSALNKAIEQGKEGLVARLMESEIDYEKLSKMAYPMSSPKDIENLSFHEMIEILGAALDVNDLGRQIYMLDPNLPAPTLDSGIDSGASEDGQKTTSLEDSSLRELEPETSTA